MTRWDNSFLFFLFFLHLCLSSAAMQTIFRHPLIKTFSLQSLNSSECLSILSCLISTSLPATVGQPPKPPPPPTGLGHWLEPQLSTLCDLRIHTHTNQPCFRNVLPDKTHQEPLSCLISGISVQVDFHEFVFQDYFLHLKSSTKHIALILADMTSLN